MTERGHLDAELVPEPFLLPLPCLLLGSLHETEIHVRLQSRCNVSQLFIRTATTNYALSKNGAFSTSILADYERLR
jgi:hypothetical protein